MSIKQYPGGIVTKNPTAPTATVAKGIWTVSQAQTYAKQGIWPRSPGAPTIGTATDAASGGKVNVTFTAPSDTGSASITSYIATSSPGGIQGTNSSSPIQVSGLTNGTAYTFQVQAINGAGTGSPSASSNSATPTAPVTGQQAYTSPGTYSWVAPTGVTSVSVLLVGGGGKGGVYGYNPCYGAFKGGGGGGGGGLAYLNNYSVTPGNSYTVRVNSYLAGGFGYFVNFCTVGVGTGGDGGNGNFCVGGVGGGGGSGYNGTGRQNGGTGGNGACSGGSTSYAYGGGGGGAAGYAGRGGYGANPCQQGFAAPAGGGGGGGSQTNNSGFNSGGGGGVGLLGQGSSGAGGTYGYVQGQGGSGGTPSCTTYNVPCGGAYGGGGAGSRNTAGIGGSGAARIIWPGNTRSFPSTCTGNL